MSESGVTLQVHLDFPGVSDEERQRAKIRLRSELRDLPIESLNEPSSDSPPIGAKAGPEAAAFGALVVSLAPHVIPHLLDFLKGWVQRNPGSATKLRYHSTGGEVVELEYDPARMNQADIEALMATLRKA